MPYKSYFSYVRVSTQRQGQQGTSLAEQTAAIERYARHWNLQIVKSYEERETAAKQGGRPVFLEMLRALKEGKADGIIIHKIDRSARNLKDWADLGALIDKGVEVHFANESLDLNSRGGRLSADIQAVVAADYIRNLREETKKGIYGRLKQGLYPFPARVGYLNAGKGKPKEPDPVQAPLVRQAFELYATGNCGLNALGEKMYEMGLRNRNGGKISRNGLVCILKNPFYMGIVKIDATGELFSGRHFPIISKRLFNAVQDVFAGRRIKKKIKHFFLFRRHIVCRRCRNLLIPERQKGNVYYRCQTKSCQQKTIREEVVEAELLKVLERLDLTREEYEYFEEEIAEYKRTEPHRVEAIRNQLLMQSSQIQTRLAKLADAYVDEVFDKETYLQKKNVLVLEQREIGEKLEKLIKESDDIAEQVERFLELLKRVCISYKLSHSEEKREMVETAVSNFLVQEKNVVIKLKMPFQIVYDRDRIPVGSPTLATSRTLEKIFRSLLQFFKNEVIAKNADS